MQQYGATTNYSTVQRPITARCNDQLQHGATDTLSMDKFQPQLQQLYLI